MDIRNSKPLVQVQHLKKYFDIKGKENSMQLTVSALISTRVKPSAW